MKRLLFVLFALLPAVAFAQVPPRYAAKFVCGKPTALETGSMAIAPGAYFTAINVHNFSTNANAAIRKRFSAGKIGEEPGAVSPWVAATLLPGQTMLVDCRDILGHLGGPPFGEGVVEMLSNVDLDVIGVYTTVGPTGQVTTMEIDRAPKR
jgi:hypothetical protein